jgi:hypothetical protein
LFTRIPHSLTLRHKNGGDRRALILAVIAIFAIACSPEAERTRSGGPGADVGNRPDPRVEPLPELHPVMDPAYGTPQLGLASTK